MKIVQLIEDLRRELVELGTLKGFHDPEVIRLSQRLDELINIFYRRKKRKKYGRKIKIITKEYDKPPIWRVFVFFKPAKHILPGEAICL